MRYFLVLAFALGGCAEEMAPETCAAGDTYTGEGQVTADSCICGDEEGEDNSSWNELPDGCVATCNGSEWELAEDGCEDVQRD